MNLLSRYAIAAVVVVLDQITKIWVNSTLELYQQIPVMPSFNITLAYNEGAAFSFLSDAGGWQRWFFIGVSVVVSVCLIVWLYRMGRNENIADSAITVGTILLLILTFFEKDDEVKATE